MVKEKGSGPRGIALAGTSAVLGLLLAFAVAEIGCRFLPVATGARAQPVHAGSPVFRFASNREYIWSIGWRFSIVNRGWVNNDGFVNDEDYDPYAQEPLLAIIGDSYVEAMMVPFSQTINGRLQQCAGEEGRVYSFAASGAPLSQYLVWADYARARYAADAMTFVIVGNDFDESLARYKTGPGFHHFVERDDGSLELQLFGHSASSLRKTLRRSAFARYLVFNLHIESVLAGLWSRLVPPAQAADATGVVGTTVAAAGTRIRHSERAIIAFFEELPRRSGLDPSRILFLLDGVRPSLYAGEEALDAVRDTYYPRMRRRFADEARARGYRVADLQPDFMAEFRRDGERFEFPEDAHWNARGHRVAARAVVESPLFGSLFPAAAGAGGSTPGCLSAP